MRVRALLAAVLLACVPLAANAQLTPGPGIVAPPVLGNTGIISANSPNLQLQIIPFGSLGCSVVIAGTWTGTLSIQKSGDGTNWVQFAAVTTNGTTAVTCGANASFVQVTLPNGLPFTGSATVTLTQTLPIAIIPTTLFSAYALQAFTTSGTYTTAANSSATTIYRYRVIGAGGGGGGANGVAATAGGGGAGAYAEGTFTGVAASTGIAVAVGTAGAGGANTGATGGTGGSSSLGTPVSVTCSGGLGGVGSTNAVGSSTSLGGAGGTVTGSPAVSIAGSAGQASLSIGTTGPFITGAGASSALGGGAVAVIANAVVVPGIVPGSGGAGNLGPTAAGGAGAAGIVIIERETP